MLLRAKKCYKCGPQCRDVIFITIKEENFEKRGHYD
jgi:hypothetical protein